MRIELNPRRSDWGSNPAASPERIHSPKRTAESNRQPEGCVVVFKATCTTACVLSAGGRGIEPRCWDLESLLVPRPLPNSEGRSNHLNYHGANRELPFDTSVSPLVERRGIEPRLTDCQPVVFPLDERPADHIGDVAFFLRQSPVLKGLGCTGPSRMCSWSRRESNPRPCNANAVSSRWTTTPDAALSLPPADGSRLSGEAPSPCEREPLATCGP